MAVSIQANVSLKSWQQCQCLCHWLVCVRSENTDTINHQAGFSMINIQRALNQGSSGDSAAVW